MMMVDSVCYICGEEPENLEHILFRCSRAVLCWKLLGIQWNLLGSKQVNFTDWWEAVNNGRGDQYFQDRINLSTYLMWLLWRTKNSWLFTKTRITEKELVDGARKEWIEFESAAAKHSRKEDVQMRVEHRGRNPNGTAVGQISLFVSACQFPEGDWGFGGVMESVENSMQWKAKGESANNKEEANLKAVGWALRKIAANTNSRILFHVDSLITAEVLNEQRVADSEVQSIADEVVNLMSTFDSCSICPIGVRVGVAADGILGTSCMSSSRDVDLRRGQMKDNRGHGRGRLDTPSGGGGGGARVDYGYVDDGDEQ
ncbi:Unknown protein [Striga hermonthica]|uniref:RNase H type-1 domain-containing protein n=1 Tax=Striga hermonthica TaxID=68872 RepID=A0A9N7RIZ0_STRHE|nr:Unknown protein [Striga hermonthica]